MGKQPERETLISAVIRDLNRYFNNDNYEVLEIDSDGEVDYILEGTIIECTDCLEAKGAEYEIQY